eukprot:2615059-Prymnesium_polylepis.1
MGHLGLDFHGFGSSLTEPKRRTWTHVLSHRGWRAVRRSPPISRRTPLGIGAPGCQVASRGCQQVASRLP